MSANPVARPSSRRSFLTAAAAGTIAGTGTLAAHVATADPMQDDSTLIAMCKEATRLLDLANAQSAHLDEIVRDIPPTPPPEALFYRSTDSRLFWSAPTHVHEKTGRRWYGNPASLHFLSTERWMKHVPDFDTQTPDGILLSKAVPDEAVQARADEIVEANRQWREQQREAERLSGYKALSDENDRTWEAAFVAMGAAEMQPAFTLAGVAAKVRAVILWHGKPADWDETTSPPPDVAIAHIFNDVLALAGRSQTVGA